MQWQPLVRKMVKNFFLLHLKSGSFLRCFREAIEIVCKSKSITSPNVTSIFDLLLNQLNTLTVV